MYSLPLLIHVDGAGARHVALLINTRQLKLATGAIDIGDMPVTMPYGKMNLSALLLNNKLC